MSLPAAEGEGAPPADLTEDGFLGGRIRLLQPRRGFRAGTASVLLAALVPARPGERVLDLGCGAGAAALCLAARVPGLDLHGIELDPGAAALARENAARNGLALRVHEGDAARPPAALRALRFDHVLANPPFFRSGAATPPPDAARRLAGHGAPGLPGHWIAAGLRRLRPGGTLSLVLPAERLAEALAALAAPAGGIEVIPVQPRAGRPAALVLIRARRGRRAPLRLHAPLVLHGGAGHGGPDGDRGAPSPEAEAVLRGGKGILTDRPTQ